MTKELKVPIAEFRYLEIECTGCHTAATFDLEVARMTPPAECAACGTKMDEKQAQAVGAFRQLYLDWRHSPKPMSFRIGERP